MVTLPLLTVFVAHELNSTTIFRDKLRKGCGTIEMRCKTRFCESGGKYTTLFCFWFIFMELFAQNRHVRWLFTHQCAAVN